MEAVQPNKVGLVLGTMIGGWHLLWAIVVAAGWAQALINFVFWIHFLVPAYVVAPFHAGMALMLIAITSTIGYAMGYILGVLWNWIQH